MIATGNISFAMQDRGIRATPVLNFNGSLRVVASSINLDMVKVASSNLAGPTKYR